MARRSWPAWLMLTVLCSVSLPVSAKGDGPSGRTRGKQRIEAPSIAAVTSATHPQVKHESRAAGSVLRIEGKGFGESTGVKAVLRAAGIEEGVTLTIVSWKDKQIELELPSITQLGMDAATAAALGAELNAARPMVSMNASIELSRDTTPLVAPIAVRIALASIDFDQDGVNAKQDTNDLDPGVR